MDISLAEVLSLTTKAKVDVFLKKVFGSDLTDAKLSEKDLKKNWTYVGGRPNNNSTISLLSEGERGLVERLTNSIDAVIEKNRTKFSVKNPTKSDDIISVAFPKFFKNKMQCIKKPEEPALDIDANVLLIANDGTSSKRTTFDVIDKGTGIVGKDFGNTILSLNSNNKVSQKQSYLIGAYGQGGSTALAFSEATIIISKKGGKYYFTIVKSVHIHEFKNISWVYLNPLEIKILDENKIDKIIIDNFVKSESGTIVRMIDTNITNNYIKKNITISGSLIDYLNIELFDVGVPVKLVDRRVVFKQETPHEAINVFGVKSVLKVSDKSVADGVVNVNIDGIGKVPVTFNIILPEKKEDWTDDAICKNTYKLFNPHVNETIIFTINGQRIYGIDSAWIKEKGANFLDYRLFVVVNLDYLGTERFKFITAARTNIVMTDTNEAIIRKIAAEIATNKTVMEYDNLISTQSVTMSLSSEEIQTIANELQDSYGDFFSSKESIDKHDNDELDPDGDDFNLSSAGQEFMDSEQNSIQDVEYFDEMKAFEITQDLSWFYNTEDVSIILVTKGNKLINQDALSFIRPVIDGKVTQPSNIIASNGFIQFKFASSSLEIGSHIIFFQYVVNNEIQITSNEFNFEIHFNNQVTGGKNNFNIKPTFDVKFVKGKELVVDILYDKSKDWASVFISLDSPQVKKIIGENNDKLKLQIRSPLVLYSLLYKTEYVKMTKEQKNFLALSYIRSLVPSLKKLMDKNIDE
ncbi:MAG: hypothetical protein Ta2E_03720 [Mycoplasmoidaceae bacterium]|nr:MAG: hypothetical protein Ta2E_03720 [Mycoplasmoidaceae bacterium]